jgi:hypothetical protein
MYNRIGFVIFISMVALVSIAQGANEVITCQPDSDSITMVIIPFFKKQFDSTFVRTFDHTKFKVADTTQIAHNLQNHELFNNTARNIMAAALRRTNNIYLGIRESEIENFRSNMLYSDVVLIHSGVKQKTIVKARDRKMKTLSGDILIYDLKWGELIARCFVESTIKFYDESEGNAYLFKKFSEDAFVCISAKMNR